MKRYKQMYRLVRYIEKDNRSLGTDFFLKGLAKGRAEHMLFAQKDEGTKTFARSRWIRRSLRRMDTYDANQILADAIAKGYMNDESGLRVTDTGRDFTWRAYGFRWGMWGAIFKNHPIFWAMIGGATTLAIGGLIQWFIAITKV